MDQRKKQGQQNWNEGNTPNRDQADGSRDPRPMPADERPADQRHDDVPRGDQERGKNRSQASDESEGSNL